MARKPTGKPNGRPKKEISAELFEKLCGLQCTEEDIAGVFECTVDTIENFCKREYGETFSEVYKKHSAAGRVSLRRAQFRLAEKSPAMAIWLGKQHLGQREPEPVKPQADMALFVEALSGAPKIGGEDE